MNMKALWLLASISASLFMLGCPEVDLGEGASDAGDSGSAGSAGTQSQDGGSAASGGSAACSSGWADCDKNAANGCETNLASNGKNCGECGAYCAAGRSCVNGQCVIEKDAGSPCNSSSECGAGQVCVNGLCVVEQDAGPCSSGWADCDGNPSNGCETNLQLDPSNCGSCANSCVSGQVCSAGSCGLTCSLQTTLCAGRCVDTATDPANCGGCAMECSAGQVCVDSSCSIGQDAGAPCRSSSECGSGEVCVGNVCVPDGDAADAADSPADACDPFTNAGCTAGMACVADIPYLDPTNLHCSPSGSQPADSVCDYTVSQLCEPGTMCMLEGQFNGHCRSFCDLGGGAHGCPSSQRCADFYHPTLGICVPK
jgi:hypothetical protein